MPDFLEKTLPPDIKNLTPEIDDLESYVLKRVTTILQSDGGFVDFGDISRLVKLILTQSSKLNSEIMYVEYLPKLIALAEVVKTVQQNVDEAARTKAIKSLAEET
ncbi:MAG: hypothetical protein EXS55_00405 [Candidatus Magasanikbacteria bacterium]|nr:hypothetical protein [Candidatus Magasanikbacteria bacterium]